MPEFARAYREARREALGQAIALTQRYAPLVVNTLAQVMMDDGANLYSTSGRPHRNLCSQWTRWPVRAGRSRLHFLHAERWGAATESRTAVWPSWERWRRWRRWRVTSQLVTRGVAIEATRGTRTPDLRLANAPLSAE